MKGKLGFSTSDINVARFKIKDKLLITPVLPLISDRWTELLPVDTRVFVKLELFQQAGSFKARGAFLGLDSLSTEQKSRGVIAASGGNHALAVSWAAACAGVNAKITMPKATDPYRIEGCKSMGADVILCEDIAGAFQVMTSLEQTEGRVMMHPFDDENMVLGASTCGAEYYDQKPEIDVFVIPVGGGGLIGGMASAIKECNPKSKIIGVEPSGAAGFSQSFEARKPVSIGKVDTIADSLGSPLTLPYSFSIAEKFVDKVVLVSDNDLLTSMQYYREYSNILAEPACAASLAAILGPLKEEIRGKSVGIIACGSNISLSRYNELMKKL